ncbi:hypothetical protein J8273_8415 [Carpediemonas membranifera]|uniref:Uncharacterized protein n=1 Tax=Carpediemonas membranifera TaxID=201153 RepID=A0A8J6DYY7_9EUKA|nr:hypothetical protein J8273_8415 [Carpediemonas membranifera]|eukprot:KAG9389741.1 hypothetical protein J8273_8415 [Carpediemonas membranifera]
MDFDDHLTPAQEAGHWNEHIRIENGVYGTVGSPLASSLPRDVRHKPQDISIHLEKKAKMPEQFNHMTTDSPTIGRMPRTPVTAIDVGFSKTFSETMSPTGSQQRTRTLPPRSAFNPANPACSPSLARTLANSMIDKDQKERQAQILGKSGGEVFEGHSFTKFVDECHQNQVSPLTPRHKMAM